MPVKYISWIRYGFDMLMINEFEGLELECGHEPCFFKNGTDVLYRYGIDPVTLQFLQNRSRFQSFKLNLAMAVPCSTSNWRLFITGYYFELNPITVYLDSRCSFKFNNPLSGLEYD